MRIAIATLAIALTTSNVPGATTLQVFARKTVSEAADAWMASNLSADGLAFRDHARASNTSAGRPAITGTSGDHASVESLMPSPWWRGWSAYLVYGVVFIGALVARTCWRQRRKRRNDQSTSHTNREETGLLLKEEVVTGFTPSVSHRTPKRSKALGDLIDGPDSASTSTIRPKQRALLVEDVDFSAKASRAVLELFGFEVCIATTGIEAIDRLRTEFFDVVFLDTNLPDLQGPAVAAVIRSLDGVRSKARIFATTAHSGYRHQADCIRSGMDGFITKPLTLEKIHRSLGRAGAVGEEPTPQQPTMSFAMLDFLAQGSRVELRRQANRLLSGIAAELTSVEAGIANRERDPLKLAAHRIITHARLAGDPVLIELAANLEENALRESFEALDQAAGKLRAQVGLVRERLEDHLRLVESL